MLGFDFWAAAEASAVLFGLFGLILAFLARDIDGWPARLCVAILSSALISAALALLERAAAMQESPDATPDCIRSMYRELLEKLPPFDAVPVRFRALAEAKGVSVE